MLIVVARGCSSVRDTVTLQERDKIFTWLVKALIDRRTHVQCNCDRVHVYAIISCTIYEHPVAPNPRVVSSQPLNANLYTTNKNGSLIAAAGLLTERVTRRIWDYEGESQERLTGQT